MTQPPVEIDLTPDFQDYRRAATRMLLMRRSYQLLLVLTATAVLLALYLAVRTMPQHGLVRAILGQAPILVFGFLPLIIYLQMVRQGQKLIAHQQSINEVAHYSFTDQAYSLRITSKDGTREGKGKWTDFARIVETDSDFALMLPGAVGMFLPKRGFRSAEDVARFRDYARRNLGVHARVKA